MLKFIKYRNISKKEMLIIAMECRTYIANSNECTELWGGKGYASLNSIVDQIKQELAKYPRLGMSYVGDNVEFEVKNSEINIFHNTVEKGRGMLLFKIEEIATLNNVKPC